MLTVETATFGSCGQIHACVQTLKLLTSVGEIHVRLIIVPANNARRDWLLHELSSGSFPTLCDLEDLQTKCHLRFKFPYHQRLSRESVDGIHCNWVSGKWVSTQGAYVSIYCGPRRLRIFDQAIAKLGVHRVVIQSTLVLLAHWCRADAFSEKTE